MPPRHISTLPVFAVQRGLATAHHNAAVHEAGIGQLLSFTVLKADTESLEVVLYNIVLQEQRF